MKEYLSTLNTRNKWVEEKRNIAPGGAVLMVDPGKPSRALAFGSNSRGFSWPSRKGQSCTRQKRKQRLCATHHKVVSVGDIKSTEGTEHSPVRGGGCSGER